MAGGYYSQLDRLGRILIVATLLTGVLSLVLYIIGEPERRYGGYLLILAIVFGTSEVLYRHHRIRSGSSHE